MGEACGTNGETGKAHSVLVERAERKRRFEDFAIDK
jgi:hypothetical protein